MSQPNNGSATAGMADRGGSKAENFHKKASHICGFCLLLYITYIWKFKDTTKAQRLKMMLPKMWYVYVLSFGTYGVGQKVTPL